MSWTSNPIFIGAHVWFAPLGGTFTSPGAGSPITQAGIWPDAGEANWAAKWAIGIVESFEIDPKYGPKEIILNPSPGTVQAQDVVLPYAIPECKFTTLLTDVLAPQLALNAQQLWATATTQFNPNGNGGPGMRGILKMQAYDHKQNLILNWQSWVFLELASGFKGAPKNMTKPEYLATLLYSANNSGAI